MVSSCDSQQSNRVRLPRLTALLLLLIRLTGVADVVASTNAYRTRDQGSLKSQLLQLLKAVFNHRSAWPFHEPVDTTVVVDYLDHIKDPVDLQLISKRIDSGSYISKAAFKADLDQMCENCLIYNTPDTNYYKYVRCLTHVLTYGDSSHVLCFPPGRR